MLEIKTKLCYNKTIRRERKENALKETLYTELAKRSFLRTVLIWLGALTAFYTVVCTPIFSWATSDVLVQRSVFPLIWETLMSACNYLYFWVVLSAVLYAYVRFDASKYRSFFGVVIAISFARYFLYYFAGCVVAGFPSINDFFEIEFVEILFNFFADILLMALALPIVSSLFKKQFAKGLTHEARFASLSNFLPADRLFDHQNKICKAALFIAFIPSAFHMLSRIIYDLSYGAPTGLADLLWIVTGYLMDALSVLIGYVVMLLLINRFYLSEIKERETDV